VRSLTPGTQQWKKVPTGGPPDAVRPAIIMALCGHTSGKVCAQRVTNGRLARVRTEFLDLYGIELAII